LVASSTAAADPAERLEATAIMGVDRFGDDIGLGSSQAPEQRPQSAPLVGARLTWVGLRTGGDTYLGIGAEAELSFTASWTGYGFDTRRESYFAPLFGYRGGLLVRWGGGRIEPHLSAGAGGVTIASASPFMAKETDPVFYWAVGATFPVGDRWQLRLDGRQAVMPGRMDGTTATAYQLQIAVGGRLAPSRRSEPVRIEVVAEPEPPRPDPNLDSDGDGIPDRLDKCPNEPELFNGFEDDDGCPEQDPDGDGIFGAADQCPNDPEDKDGFQDADGCPDPDNDGDGIPDTRDACPDQPETFNGIDDEDGCPDEDGDNDGVLGSQDQCPDEPEDIDGFQDDDGCPDEDDDGDGRPDVIDACPREPETLNGFQDDDGCPDEIPPQVAELTGVIPAIQFRAGTATLQRSSFAVLDRVVALLKAHPAVRLHISGHTDDRGVAGANVLLSRSRAEAVRRYLIDKGIAADRLEATGHGAERPIADNKTAGGRAKNRRIELALVPGPAQIPDPRRVPESPASDSDSDAAPAPDSGAP
jgi:outer membrane protein OmpA-like peptidoglycan-associated protein